MSFVNVRQVARRGIDDHQIIAVHRRETNQRLQPAGMFRAGIGAALFFGIHQHDVIGAFQLGGPPKRQKTGQVARVTVEVDAGRPQPVLGRRDAQQAGQGRFPRAALEASNGYHLHGTLRLTSATSRGRGVSIRVPDELPGRKMRFHSRFRVLALAPAHPDYGAVQRGGHFLLRSGREEIRYGYHRPRR